MDMRYWIRRKPAKAGRLRAVNLPPFMLPRKAPATPLEDSLLRLRLPVRAPFATPRSKPKRPPRRDPSEHDEGTKR